MMHTLIKTDAEIACLKESGKRLAKVLASIIAIVKPGVSTKDLDTLAEQLIQESGGIPVFKGYGGGTKKFPASLCTSINEEVVHGIPRIDKIAQNGDLLKLDIGMRFDGMVTDMARTVKVGNVSSQMEKLVSVTEESLRLGISELYPGASLSHYASVVQHYVEANGFSIVRDLVGHGVGRELHEEPQIPNYVSRTTKDCIVQKGMTLALEPMVNAGTFDVNIAPDNWTFVTVDGKWSAHFEDTVVITENGAEIVTKM